MTKKDRLNLKLINKKSLVFVLILCGIMISVIPAKAVQMTIIEELKNNNSTKSIVSTQKTGFNAFTADSNYAYISDDELTLDDPGNFADIDALEYLNLGYAKEVLWASVASPSISISIIDSGMHPEVWFALEYLYKVDIDYHECRELDNGNIEIYTLHEHTDWNNNFNGDQRDNHGWWTTSILASATSYTTSKKIKIHVYGIGREPNSNDLDLFNPIFFKEAIQDIEMSYENKGSSSYQNDKDFRPVKIVSMSFGGPEEYRQQEIQDSINNLYSNYGVYFFASSGNSGVDIDTYPACYDSVYSVGAIFDDTDGMTTPRLNGEYDLIDLAGQVVTPDLSDDFYNRDRWGSNYPNGLDFVGPGFDVEVIHYDMIEEQLQVAVIDGTSAACPFIAGGAFLVYLAFNYFNDEISDELHKIGLILKYSTEGFSTDGVTVICNTPDDDFDNYSLNEDYYRDTMLGYGIIDFNDAVRITIMFDLYFSPELICPSVATSNFEVKLLTSYQLDTIITKFTLERNDAQSFVETRTYSDPASDSHTFDISSITSSDYFWVTVTVFDTNGVFLFSISQEIYITITVSSGGDPPSRPTEPSLW
ncbi:MAG: S8/S53 family peptidase [Candidatus Kariarchaeaceae archaeon]